MIGSGSEITMRHSVKSVPMIGNSQATARPYPIKVQLTTMAMVAPKSAPTVEQRACHRIGGEGTAGQDRAERGADQQALQSGGRPERSRYFLVRQNFRDERAEQATGQHARQDFAEQRKVMLENFPYALAPSRR